jgi:hypothetical protein
MATADRSKEPDPLEDVLQDAEAELRRRLAEACDAEASGAPSDTAAEIRQLENSLLAAAVAAEQTLTLRRHIERRKATPPAPEEGTSSEPPMRLREFQDAEGRRWRAWPVTPGQARPGSTIPYLGEYHKGWICFEALESSARRRLPVQPAGWSELPEGELVRLLEQAITSPARKARPQPSAGESPAPR